MQTIAPPRLGDILVSHGIITQEQLREGLQQQVSTRQRLGTVLMSNGWATEEEVTRARGLQMDVPYVSVSRETPAPLVTGLVTFEIAHRCLLLPLSLETREDGVERLRVAMADPWDVEAIDLVQRETRKRVEPLLASEGALQSAIERAYHDSQDNAASAKMSDSLAQATLEGGDAAELEDMRDDVDVGDAVLQSSQAPVIRFVNTLFANAIRHRASDIHIEPQKKDFQIRFRVDGQMQVAQTVPRQFLAATVSRIKIMGEMDISEKRLPLDGRISLRVEGKSIDLRVSTLPTQYGERVVMRILDRSAARLTLDQLGFSASNRDTFNQMIHKPHGIILVTGPTGSGKTTTLYAALNALRSPTTNIITCEDPIEFMHPDKMSIVSQREIGLDTDSFADALKYMLRQNPDIILVGEMRDIETMSIGLSAAETGHLVMSTLHTASAAETLDRIINMYPPQDRDMLCLRLSGSLKGVISQKLPPRADGTGRVGAVEVMVVTPTIAKLIEEGRASQLYGAIAEGNFWGMQTMNQCLIKYYKAGLIAEEEAIANAGNVTEMKQMIRRP